MHRAGSRTIFGGQVLAKLLIFLIRIYQLTLSKLILWTLGPVCRFEPSCSRYAVACLRDHGAFRGGLLSFKRLCRCQPFHPGGYDPPPPPNRPGALASAVAPPPVDALPIDALPIEAVPVDSGSGASPTGEPPTT